MSNNNALTGTVKFFNAVKGFGFISEDNTGTEYFVHITGCVDSINENDAVKFDVKEGQRGPSAINVELI